MSKKIRLFLILVISLILFVIYFLFKGISLDSFSFGNIYVKQLYLKYDKKLIVRVNEFKINKESTTQNSFDDINKIIGQLPKILQFFQEIDIKSLQISGNEFTILFNKDNIYFDSKFLNLSAVPKFYANTLELDLYSFYLKDIKLFFDGKIKLNTKTNSIDLFGNSIYKYAQLNLNLNWSKDELTLFVNSKEVKDLKFLKDFFRLNKIAEEWMYEKIEGKFILKDFFLSLNPKTFAPNIESIQGKMQVRNAKIKFNKELDVLKSPLIDVDFKNNRLSFDIKKAKYKDKNLQNSKVIIKNLTSEKNGVVNIELNSTSILDEDILSLLKVYKIELPLKQLSGSTKSNVKLSLAYDIKKKIDIKGNFFIKNSNISLKGFNFNAKEAKVTLNNNIINITKAAVTYNNMIDATTSLRIDLNKSNAKGELYLNSFNLENKNDKLVEIKKINTPIRFSFKDDIEINLAKLNTKIKIDKTATKIFLSDISLVAKNSKFLKDMGVTKGNLDVSIFSKDDIRFTSNLKNLDIPYLSKNSKKIDSLSLNGKITNTEIKVISSDNSINVLIENNKTPFIKLSNYQILLYKLNNSSNKEVLKLDFSLKDIDLFVKESESYFIDKMNVKIDKKISFEGLVSKLKLPILKKDGKPLISLALRGNFENKTLSITSIDKKIFFKLIDNKLLKIKFDGLDIEYNTEAKEQKNNLKEISIDGKNSSIVMNKTKKVLADSYSIKIEDKAVSLNLKHKNSKLIFTRDNNLNMLVKGEKLNDTLLNTFLNKELFKGGTIDVDANGKESKLKGKAVLTDVKIKNMAALNNLILLVNTSPALLNPLLAIPTFLEVVTQDGFNLNGYVVTKGKIDFTYHLKDSVVDLSRIKLKGNTVDLEGFATLDLKDDKIDSHMYLVFMKSYSLMVKHIPIINYVFLGDDKRVDTLVQLTGKLSDPIINTNLASESASIPFDIIKRILYLPIRAVEALIPDDKTKEEK